MAEHISNPLRVEFPRAFHPLPAQRYPKLLSYSSLTLTPEILMRRSNSCLKTVFQVCFNHFLLTGVSA